MLWTIFSYLKAKKFDYSFTLLHCFCSVRDQHFIGKDTDPWEHAASMQHIKTSQIFPKSFIPAAESNTGLYWVILTALRSKERGEWHHRVTQHAAGCSLWLVHSGSATPESRSWFSILLLPYTQQLSHSFSLSSERAHQPLFVIPFTPHAFWRPFPIDCVYFSSSVTRTGHWLTLYILAVPLK